MSEAVIRFKVGETTGDNIVVHVNLRCDLSVPYKDIIAAGKIPETDLLERLKAIIVAELSEIELGDG